MVRAGVQQHIVVIHGGRGNGCGLGHRPLLKCIGGLGHGPLLKFSPGTGDDVPLFKFREGCWGSID